MSLGWLGLAPVLALQAYARAFERLGLVSVPELLRSFRTLLAGSVSTWLHLALALLGMALPPAAAIGTAKVLNHNERQLVSALLDLDQPLEPALQRARDRDWDCQWNALLTTFDRHRRTRPLPPRAERASIAYEALTGLDVETALNMRED